MRNRLFLITGTCGIAQFGQLCNGLLRNCLLNTHHPLSRFRAQAMKPISVLP
jgi:hypothetical protein